MTKSELLASMVELGACSEARNYVSQHASDDALIIGLQCKNSGWLIWYLGRRDPVGIAAFARRCADRSGSRFAEQYARISLDYATSAVANAHYGIDCAAAYVVDYAAVSARASASYARATVAERAEQLRDLHEMWSVLMGGGK